MSTISTIPGIHEDTTGTAAGTPSRPRLAVCLPALTADAQQAMQMAVATAFPSEAVLVVSPDHELPVPESSSITSVLFPSHRSGLRWALAAGDYLTADEVAKHFDTEFVLLLNDDSVNPAFLQEMAAQAFNNSVDLTLPRYSLPPHEGLVNSALLYPLSRSLFASDIRFPLPLNIIVSRRAAERLAGSAQRASGKTQPETLLWPVAEAALAGLPIRQVDAGERSFPPPPETDFNALFSAVAGSLFSDIEAKASFWQRARGIASPASSSIGLSPAVDETLSADVSSLIDGYRLAYANLLEVWSLVLPPQSLLALKRLSTAAPESFRVPPQLWSRIVFDFILAYHLRTLNRGHLLGAFTSLYLAWVASYIQSAGHDFVRADQLAEETAAAFERERPYLLSRWRWPDRFNP